MDNRWSSYVQTPIEIDSHRELRFRDKYKNSILEAIGAKAGMSVADIGCGAGTLSRKLSDWLGEESRIIGVDRDSNFIEYSRKKANDSGYDIEYINADAYNIPIKDNTLDICTSHTVIEHVEHERFLEEQKRIVKPNGRVSIMSIRTDKSVYVYNNDEVSEYKYHETSEEIELRKLIQKAFDYEKKHDVSKVQFAQHNIDVKSMPLLFERLGFSDIRIEGISITNAIDDDRNSFEYKTQEIDARKIAEIEPARKAHLMNPNIVTKKHFEKIIAFVEKRAAYRLYEIMNNRFKWDFTIKLMVIVSGKVVK